MHYISYNSIRNNIHNGTCHKKSAQDRNGGFFDIHLKKRGDQCTCPGSCARKRDSHKQQKSKKFISLDLSLFPIALFSSFVIRPLNVFVFFIHLKICRIKSRINGIGTIFPTIQIGNAFAADIFSREAARRPLEAPVSDHRNDEHSTLGRDKLCKVV